MDVLVGIGIGLLAGGLRALIGWWKSGEAWAGWKTGRTLAIAAIEGAVIGGLANQDPRILFAEVYGGTIALEELAVSIARAAKKA